MMFNPPPDSPVRGGDHLIVMGRPHDLRKLEGLLDGRGSNPHAIMTSD